MIINTNMSALTALRSLGTTNAAMDKNLAKLSSGLRINRAADDAAGLAISETMRSQEKGLNQAMRNAQDGISLIQTAEGGMNEVHSILQRMRELAVQSANDTNQNSDRDQTDLEYQALVTEIGRIGDSTTFNGQKLIDGSFTGKLLQVGSGNTAGTDDITVDIDTVKGLVTGNVKLQTAANASVAELDTAIAAVSTGRAKLGALQNRLEHTINNLSVSSENVTAAGSRIRDVDMAKEMADFTKNQILSQAGTAMLAQANQRTQGILSLFR